ncbi:MAG TPA: type II secretion system minor pseudopilin GspJ [Allosphingosinicella sp.]
MGPDFRQDDEGFTSSRRSAEHGFTLVELLVSLFIFALLSAAGVALLSFSVRAQETAEFQLGRIGDLRRTGALLSGDLAQAAARPWRDENGDNRPAFTGASGEEGGRLLAFVRRGAETLGETPRPSLQRVEYRLEGDRLERRSWTMVDGAPPKADSAMLEGVRRVRLRYRDRSGEWRDRWDPTALTDLPRAVEIVVDSDEAGATRMLFLAGAVA